MGRRRKVKSIRRGEQSQAGGIESKIRHSMAPGSKRFGTKRDYNRGKEKQKFKRWVEGEYEEGCVYFINMEGTNYLKIGYTYNFDKRLRQLQNNVPVGLVVLGQDWTERPRELERDYHRVFKSYRLRSGEWFDIPNMVEEVSRYRNMFAESYGVNEEIMGDLEYDE